MVVAVDYCQGVVEFEYQFLGSIVRIGSKTAVATVITPRQLLPAIAEMKLSGIGILLQVGLIY